LCDHPAALIERAYFHAAVIGNDLERRAKRRDIPARIPPGEFIPRREVNATVMVELAREVFEAFTEAGPANGARDHNPVGSRVAMIAHRRVLRELLFRIAL
jgi:hypothetical protein